MDFASIYRFSSQEECETVCVVYDEMSLSGDQTSFSRKAICKQVRTVKTGEIARDLAHIPSNKPYCRGACTL